MSLIATEDNKGAIATRAQIGGPRRRPTGDCFINVKLRGKWQWQNIDNISVKTFQKYRKEICKTLSIAVKKSLTDEKCVNLKLTGVGGRNKEYLEGIYQAAGGFRNGEYQLYQKGEYWLYTVDKRWWVGTRENADRRRAWGFIRQKLTLDAAGSVVPIHNIQKPWEVREWEYWCPPVNGVTNGGRWVLATGAPGTERTKFTLQNTKAKLKTKYKKKEQELASIYDDHLQELDRQKERCQLRCERHRVASAALYNKTSVEERKKLIEMSIFRDLFRKERICSICYSVGDIKKCIHPDCIGACKNCHSINEDDNCRACGKEQKLECPVCQETYPQSFMNIFPCQHGVCWKCSYKSYECKKPIKKCPMCRKPISILHSEVGVGVVV